MAHRRVRSLYLSIVPLFSIHVLLKGALGPRICSSMFGMISCSLSVALGLLLLVSSSSSFFEVVSHRRVEPFSGSMLTYPPTTLQRTFHTMPLEFGTPLTRRSRVNQVPTAFSLFSVLALSDPHVDYKPKSDPLMVASWQHRLIQYGNIPSNSSSAPQPHNPAMGRRQRREPINYSAGLNDITSRNRGK